MANPVKEYMYVRITISFSNMYIRRRQANPVIAASSVQYQVALPDAAPKNILEAIVWNKELEVDQQRLKRIFWLH